MTAAEPALAGRTAVISGASRGIGAECARLLDAEGARVVLLGRNPDTLVAVARDLHDARCIRCDVADLASVRDALAGMRGHADGAPDILVNNAAEFLLAPLERTSVDAFERLLEVNVRAPFAFIHELLPAMRARGSGHIVNIGSIADHRAFRSNAAYGASKYAMRGLHEVLRTELRGTGIRATLISPGHVDTALWDTIDPAEMKGVGPRERMLGASAVAEAVRWAVTRPADVNVDELRLSSA